MLSTNSVLKFSLIILLSVFSCLNFYGQNEVIDTTDYVLPYFKEANDINLLIAASRGYSSEINRLINKGARVDVETVDGATPLIYAVANNHLDAVKTILAYNPDVNKVTESYQTPLLIAVKNQNVEISEALIRGGADLNKTDNYGAAPLHYAAIYGAFYVTDLLLYYNADCNLKAKDGTTPLMAAIYAGYADIADLLIQSGSNMEARDNQGFTPFLIAAQNGDTLIMDVLLKYGVDLYEKNAYNYNALDIAIESNNKPAVEFLLARGDKWGIDEKAGINPYSIASAFGRKEIIELLEKKGITGKVNPGLNEMSVCVSSKFTTADYFSGFSIKLREPVKKAGIIAGCDLKLWYTKVMKKSGENIFYQYLDKSALIYTGVFKDFKITGDSKKAELSLYTSLSAGYTFGNKLKGTNVVPQSRFVFLPEAGLKIQKGQFILSAGLEYLKSDYYHLGPIWLRAGLGYSFYFKKARSPGKVIKWY